MLTDSDRSSKQGEASQFTWPPPLTMGHLWLALPLVILIIIGFRHYLRLLDFWWHLKIGQIILDTQSIPRTDLFSYTVEGTLFVLQNWLTEVIYYLIYTVGGFPLLIFANAMLLAVTFLLIYNLCWRATGRRIGLSVFSVSIMIPGLMVFSNLRPQSVSFLFFAIFYWILHNYVSGRRNLLWLLPILIGLWVNLHGAFVLGLGLIGFYFGSELLRRLILDSAVTLSPKKLGWLLGVFVAAWVASLLNPEGFGVYEYVLTVAKDPGSQQYVTEWQTPSVESLEGLKAFYIPFFISLFVFLFAKRRPGFTDFLLYFGFAFFALTALRNGIWFILVVPPIMGRSLPSIDLGELVRGTRLAPALTAWRRSKRKQQASHSFNLIVVALMLLGCTVSSPWLYPRVFDLPLLDPETPVGAMDYLEKNRISERVFHPQAYGDYLIWRLWPEQRSFLDGRVHIFGEEVVRDYLSTFAPAGWEAQLDKHGISYLLLNKNPDLVKSSIELAKRAKASPVWEVVYEDDLSILLEKQDE